MKKYTFPLLNADQIECRIGSLNKEGTKANLLLYKDARVDMNMLDSVVGMGNWQRDHKEVKGVCYCGVSIWDDDKNCWITKWDAGKESNTEAEKGEASDSFKRACVNATGVGRELYTAPKNIWVAIGSKYDRFDVRYISYNDNKEINGLEIVNEKGELVYSFGNSKNKVAKQNYSAKPQSDVKEAIKNFVALLPIERKEKFMQHIVADKYYVGTIDELNDQQALAIFNEYVRNAQ